MKSQTRSEQARSGQTRAVQTFDGFYSQAPSLRKVFDQRFKNPLQSSTERFVWDYWHVPDEYTLLRTPAYTYFPRTIYERFHRYLVAWGREHLGCHDISPPWLSCYIEGCRQEPHQDVPHGPLAFVYSLTSPQARLHFRGGETFIKRPRTLIEPRFNRLVVFNPALVHGVKRVTGTHDPRFGRLVIHGWFVNPRPFWVGPLTPEHVQETLDSQLPLEHLPWGSGLLSLRLRITRSGRVSEVRELVNTLDGHGDRAHISARQEHLRTRKFLSYLKEMKFPTQKSPTVLTLPLQLER